MRVLIDCRPGALLAAIVTAASVACHRSTPSASPAPVRTVASQDGAARATAVRDSIARAEAARHAAAREDSSRAATAARMATLAAARSTLIEAIHFDFDRSEIRATDRPILDRKAGVLRANRSLHVRIEGNTDERGSDEYNLALGMRRAGAAKRYLAERGVDSATLTTMSSGEERPVCQQHDEDCWSKNRRAEFTIVSGGDVTIVPEQ